MSAPDEAVLALLTEHHPVIGAFHALGSGSTGRAIVGCSCLSARDYQAAGFKAGQAGYRAHLAQVITAHYAQQRDQIAARVLREAAEEVAGECADQSGECFCSSRDWLRARADQLDGGQR